MSQENKLSEQRNYPRVSEIISPWTRKSFENIPLEVLLKAANRGSQVHAYCTAFIRGDFVPSPSEEINAYRTVFTEWWRKLESPTVLLSEKRLYDDQDFFSGQSDIIYQEKGGENFLVDIKTSSVPSPSWKIQLAAYLHLANKNGFDVKGAYIVHLKIKKSWLDARKTEKTYFPHKFDLYFYDKEALKECFDEYFYPALRWYKLFN